MTQLDYTWERREQLIRKEEYEEGLNDGLEQGRRDGLEQGRRDGLEQGKRFTVSRMLQLPLSVEQIAQAVGESLATVERWIGELKQPADEGLHIG